MSYRSNGNLPKKFRIVVTSEELFLHYMLYCVKTGLLKVGKDITKKQYEELKSTGGHVSFRTQTMVTYTDGAATSGKPVTIYTTNIAGSPMRALAQASQREYDIRYTMATAARTAAFYGHSKIYGYFLTITIPNVGLGKLKKAFRTLSRKAGQFRKAIEDATRRKGNLQLTGRYGKAVALLGAVLKLEITVNEVSLKNHFKTNLYHPHAHILLITDAPLNCQLTKFDLFQYWQKKNPSLQLSAKAFKLEPCYSKDGIAVGDSAALRSAVVEAAKYTIKPDYYKHFPKVPTKYAAKIFAELRRATKGAQVMRSSGIMAKAKGFINWSSRQKPLHEAMLAGGYDENMPLEDVYVPDVYSRVSTIRNGHVLEDRELTGDELLGANRTLLQNAILDDVDHHLAMLKWPDSEKGRLYRYLVESTDFIKSRTDLMKRFDLWEKARQYQWNNLYSQLQLETDDDKAADLEARLEKVTLQQDDLQRLREAIPNDLRQIRYCDLRRVAKLRALFEIMKRRGCRIVYDRCGLPQPILDSDPDESDAIEQALAKIYLSDGMHEVKYIDPETIAAYVTWVQTGNIYTDSSDKKEFNGVASIMWWQLQDDIDNLADKSDDNQQQPVVTNQKPVKISLDEMRAMMKC